MSSDQKTLVAYFSCSGETRRLAGTLAGVMDADLYEIEPEAAYTSADLNWNDKRSRSSIEMEDAACRPPIREAEVDVEQYDTVFVGFPIWWYEAPRIIATFLESYDFSGKKVIPFATSGGSGMGKTEEILKRICHAADWLPGRRLSSHASPKELTSWVEKLGL